MSLTITNELLKMANNRFQGNDTENPFIEFRGGAGVKFDSINIIFVSANEIEVCFLWERKEMFVMRTPRHIAIGDTIHIIGLDGAMGVEVNL